MNGHLYRILLLFCIFFIFFISYFFIYLYILYFLLAVSKSADSLVISNIFNILVSKLKDRIHGDIKKTIQQRLTPNVQ